MAPADPDIPLDPPGSDSILLTGSAVAMSGQGVLIQGSPGAGKSTLALEVMAYGADLIADDRVWATPVAGAVLLTAPLRTRGLIEARGVGLLKAEPASAALALVIDLDEVETSRLPRTRETVIAGRPFPSLARVEHPAFAAMVLAYLKGGRHAP